MSAMTEYMDPPASPNQQNGVMQAESPTKSTVCLIR
jgi:hypothetical protein